MDLITLALAKKYTDEKAGYSEQNVFTFDGNTEGKLVVNNMVRVSTKKIDATTAVSVTGMAGGVEQTIVKENMTIDDGVLSFQGLCFVLCSNGEDEEYPVGVYVLATEEMYVSRVEFAETIHPIDPKFIPGAVLPVVELSTEPTEEGAPLTEKESAAIQAAYDTGMPCVVKMNLQLGDGDVAKISMLLVHMKSTFTSEAIDAYAADVSGRRFNIIKSEGVWTFSAVNL